MNKNYLILLYVLFLCNSSMVYGQLPKIITTIAGNGYGTGTPVGGYSGDDGPSTAAKLNYPGGVTLDESNNLYIADTHNNRIRKTTLANAINATGTISTVFGIGTPGFSGDGGPASAAQLYFPADICRDLLGNFYIADDDNYRIRMVTIAGVITTIAGNGINGFSGDGGAATNAKIGPVEKISVDVYGNIYIGDQSAQRIRKVNSAGIISTIAGNGTAGYSGDGGPATAAELNWPRGTCTDRKGNLYIADYYNNRIRKVDTFGMITTFAGIGGITTYSGDGGAATLAHLGYPSDVDVDSFGNIYIADYDNFVVRKVDTFGVITTVAGTGLQGYSGDGCAATAAQLHYAGTITTDGGKFLYIADGENHRIRRVGPDHPPSFTHGHEQNFTVCAGVASSIDTFLAAIDSDAGQQETWAVVAPPLNGTAVASYVTTSTGDTLLPVGLSYTASPTYSGNDSFKISVYDCVYMADTTTIHVTVNPLPNVGTITGSSGVCVGAVITLTDLAAGGTWSSSAPGIATVGTSGAVRGITTGTVTISYSATNYCGTVAATKLITVSSTASSSISGPSAVCTGNTITLTESVTGGTWGSSNTHASVTSGGAVTGISPGIDTISYTVTNSCGSATAVHMVTVNLAPFAGSITGPSSLCQGDSASLTNSTGGGLWSSSATGIATIGSAGRVRAVSGGTAIISYTVTNSCGSVAATHTLTVIPTPAASPITGPSAVCPGNAILLSDSISGGVWACSNSHASVTSAGVVSAISAGIDTISYSVTNSCGSATVMHIVTVQPLPAAGTITGPSSVCAGATIPLTDTTGGGAWGSSAPGIATVSATGVAGGISGGPATISYSVTNSCGTATATHPVTVNPLPAPGAIAGPSVVCVGAAITLSDGPAGGVWSAANGNAAISGSAVRGISAGIDTISYTLTNLCGSAPAIKIITVDPLPSAGVITGSFTIHLCIGSTISLSDAEPGGLWSSSNARATVSGGIVTGLSQGRDTIFYTVTNSCGTAAVSHVVSVNPTPHAGVITGPSFLCAGSTIMLTDTSSGGVWGSKDTLIASINGLGSVTGLSAGTDTVIYTVTDTLCFATAIKVITVNPLPGSGIITTSLVNAFCIGDTITVHDTVAGGTWGITNAHAALAGNVLSAVSPGADTLLYTVTNSCGAAIARYAINISYMPPIQGGLSLCVGDTSYLYDSVSGGRWSGGGTGLFLDAVAADSSVIAGIAAGTYIVGYAMDHGCAAYATVTVDPLPYPGHINGAAEICTGLATLFTDSITGGKWSSNNTVATINSSGEVQANGTAGVGLITYTVKDAATGCVGISLFTLNVVAPAFHISDSSTQPLCYGDNDGAIAVSVAGSGGPYQYSWASGDTLPAINNISAGSYTIIVKDLSTQCTETDTFQITAPDSLSITADVKNDYCNEHKGSITATVSGGTAAYSYLWSNKSTASEISDLAVGNYVLTVTDNNGCLKTLTIALADSNCDGVVIHDAISPNGDGINDTWVIEGLQHYPGNTVQVFDKWGSEVFSETNYKNDWGGTNKNSLLPDGTYYYLVKLNADNSAAGGKNAYTGSLMIKR